MNMEQERNNIIQPTSWETILALEARRPLEELTSSPAPTALHATARAFILSTYQKPTLYSAKHLAECISIYNHRHEKWQKRQEELREEEELQDELEEQEASFAVESNARLNTLNNFQNTINYYTDLLPSAQKCAAETAFLASKIPINLSPKDQRACFIKLLQKHAVIYTPSAIVDTINKCIRYFRLQWNFFYQTTQIDNYATTGYVEAENRALFSYHSTSSVLSGRVEPSLIVVSDNGGPEVDLIASDLAAISFSKEELSQLDAWISLKEDFPVPPNFPEDTSYNTSALAEDTTFLSLPTPSALKVEAPILSAQQDITKPTLPKKLPKMHGVAKLPSVCKFLYGLSQDVAFCEVPTTSAGVKALMDKLLTPAFTQLYSHLRSQTNNDLASQYRLATKRLGDYYKKFQEKECEAQSKQILSDLTAYRENLPAEDPAKDYREQPQKALAYLNNVPPTEEDLSSQEEI